MLSYKKGEMRNLHKWKAELAKSVHLILKQNCQSIFSQLEYNHCTNSTDIICCVCSQLQTETEFQSSVTFPCLYIYEVIKSGNTLRFVNSCNESSHSKNLLKCPHHVMLFKGNDQIPAWTQGNRKVKCIYI